MAGELVTGPGLIQWGTLLLGRWQAGATVTPYRWQKLSGWAETPGLDSGNAPRAQQHGSYAGRLLAQTRTVTLEGLTVRAPAGQIGAAVRALEAATGIEQDEQPLVVWLDDRGPMMIRARLTRRALAPDGSWALGYSGGGAVQWEATDPRRYDLTEQTASAGLPRSESGLDWSVTTGQVLIPAQQAGQTPTSGWWAAQGLTVGSAGPAVTVTVTAASAGTPAMVGWSGTAAPATLGWPVTVGQAVRFVADALPPGAALAVHWVSGAGAYLSQSGETAPGLVVGTAPAGTAYARPIMMWTAVPSPATVPVGQTRLYIPDPGPGLPWGSPTESGLTWGTPGSTGDMTCTNAGSAATFPVIEIRGPATTPSVTLPASGVVLEYDLTLAASDVLVIDTLAGTVLLGGQSRLGYATNRSQPEGTFSLPKLATSTVSFRSSDAVPNPAASCTVRWRSAYW
ncbi:hypothetical protein [Kitasatospora sp. McL0602]|uniref:hypothetical protein n=1 Tax=Kitasatospora sp. McL0602 TaxID=3439530 RepID=UPI003F8C743A